MLLRARWRPLGFRLWFSHPAIVEAGSPELIRVNLQDAVAVEGEWLGRKIVFFRGRDRRSWAALAGVDVEQPEGPSHLGSLYGRPAASPSTQARTLTFIPRTTAPACSPSHPKFVEPSPDELKVIQADSAIKSNVFASSAAEPLWSGNFRAPVLTPPTDSFGTRRTFNGKLASVHKGMDFRAHTGTVVRAGNSGVVVLARLLYYEGNCVVIDHGLGLYTLSMHLSRIDVHEGQPVKTGDHLGLSGATGRVTGPHLHWAVRWQDAYLDPAKMLRLNLSAVR